MGTVSPSGEAWFRRCGGYGVNLTPKPPNLRKRINSINVPQKKINSSNLIQKINNLIFFILVIKYDDVLGTRQTCVGRKNVPKCRDVLASRMGAFKSFREILVHGPQCRSLPILLRRHAMDISDVPEAGVDAKGKSATKWFDGAYPFFAIRWCILEH